MQKETERIRKPTLHAVFSSSTRTRPALPLWAVGELQAWHAQSSVMSQEESNCPKRVSNHLLAGPGQETGSSAQKRRTYVFVCVHVCVVVITHINIAYLKTCLLKTWSLGFNFLHRMSLLFFLDTGNPAKTKPRPTRQLLLRIKFTITSSWEDFFGVSFRLITQVKSKKEKKPVGDSRQNDET